MYAGSFPALATPFKANSEIDFEAYGRLLDWHVEKGSNGVVPCGCTGEAATLSHEEQKQVIRFAVERIAGRVPVIAGTGSNNTREAIELTQYAREAGADGALLITPYYNKPTAAGQIAHYRAIAEAVDGLPIMLYNVPGRTCTTLLPETIAALNEIPNIVSVKEACGSVEQVANIIALCDINVLSGDDALTLPMMAVGAKGVVSVAANVAPAEVAALVRHANAGNFEEARALHYQLLPLFKILFIETNPMPVKYALSRMGLMENVLRLPLTPVLEASQPRIDEVLKQQGLI